MGDVIGAESGFYLDPVTLRAADAAFISNEKLTQITDPEKYLPFPPDLAVEVVSPGDAAANIQEKVDAYLTAGTALVWIIYPRLRQVIAHHPGGTARTYHVSDMLDGGDMLPGLAIPVTDLFPPEKNA